MSTENGANDEDARVDAARRKLLKAAVYVAPAVVSAVVVDRAHAQPTPSCTPSICPPQGGPCSPSNCGPNRPCNPNR
ncbi:MAG: hypothetical protein GXY23_14715 [Myxococcales bacterium]|nr:hypothetical protein [Myxococcales bacterium]